MGELILLGNFGSQLVTNPPIKINAHSEEAKSIEDFFHPYQPFNSPLMEHHPHAVAEDHHVEKAYINLLFEVSNEVACLQLKIE